jgi:ABC-type nitrate/sulfonate/bicarbonate transport system substrate-binding protein
MRFGHALIAAATMGLALAIGSAPPAAAADTVTVGMVGKASTTNWPIYIGMAEGMFKNEKLKIDLVFVSSNAGVQQQLAAGSLNLAVASGVVDPIRAINAGAPVAIVLIDAETPPYSLLGKASIGSLKDLKGKTIVVGGAKDITRTYLERMLAPNGLKAGDYDLIYAGSTAARYAALQSGTADAAILTVPYNFTAEAAGYKNLGDVVDYAADLPFAATVVSKPWASSHKAVLQRFLTAYVKAMDWFYGNRDKAIKVMADASGISPAEIGKAYDYLKHIKEFATSVSVSKSKLTNILDVLKKNGDVDKSLTIDKLVLPGVTQFRK